MLTAVTALVACKPPALLNRETVPPTMNKVIEHVVIDDAVIDKGDAFDVVDPVWWTADIYHSEQQYNKSLEGFSQEQRYLLAIAWHLTEVNNGGHDQFYFNSTGIVWRDALAGYTEVGLVEAAAILEESVARMGGDLSLDRIIRQEQLDTTRPDFGDLDDRFYKLQETINFNYVMMKYIADRRSAFYFDGNVEKAKLPNQ